MPASFSACDRVMVLIGDFVLLVVPDFLVVVDLAPRAKRQDEAVEQYFPEQRVLLDHARIGEEILQIPAHGGCVGSVGRAEVDEQHADSRYSRRRAADRSGIDGSCGRNWRSCSGLAESRCNRRGLGIVRLAGRRRRCGGGFTRSQRQRWQVTHGVSILHHGWSYMRASDTPNGSPDNHLGNTCAGSGIDGRVLNMASIR